MSYTIISTAAWSDQRSDQDVANACLRRTIVSIDGMTEGSEGVEIAFECGARLVMHHQQDCCEHVYLAQIDGDPNDLVGELLMMFEVVSDGIDRPALEEYEESWTWTFYKLATAKGYVTLRWYGSSNGYYSEDVDLSLCVPDPQAGGATT